MTLKKKKESQISRESLKRSNKKLMKNSKLNKRKSAIRKQSNSKIWRDNKQLNS